MTRAISICLFAVFCAFVPLPSRDVSASPAPAQVLDQFQITASGSTCATAGACAVFNALGTSAGYAYTISGTFSGTLQFEGTLDGVSWFATAVTKLADLTTVASSTTGTGQFKLANNGWLAVRVRASALASGTATVTLTRGYAW